MKRSYIIRTAGLFLSILTISGYSQTADTDPTKPTAAVLNLYTNLDSLTPETCGNLLRIELVKTEKYSVLDRYDILEDLRTKSLDLNDCYGKKCLSEIGRGISVDKMFSGSIEQMGNKIVISLKILDVKNETYDKTTIMEFINDRNEIQTMVQLTINTMLGIENDLKAFKRKGKREEDVFRQDVSNYLFKYLKKRYLNEIEYDFHEVEDKKIFQISVKALGKSDRPAYVHEPKKIPYVREDEHDIPYNDPEQWLDYVKKRFPDS